MIEILKEYIKSYLVLNEDKAQTRSGRSEDARLAIKKINSYYRGNQEKKGQRLKPVSWASQGTKDTDVEVQLIGHPDVDPDFIWNFEVKSFGENDKFSIEISNPSSLVRQIVLKPDSGIGSKESMEKQYREKLASAPAAIRWVEDNLQSPDAATRRRRIIIPGSDEPRGLYLKKGEIGDWGRLKAIGDSGKPRVFYTVSNYDLKQSEKEMFYTDELEKAIKNQFRQKNDHVLIIRGSDGSVRCFSLTKLAQKVFNFPMFYTGGSTLEPETARLSSFGGEGRITAIVQVKPGRGFVIE